MIGTLVSLREWVRDQIAEIRHLAPVTVVAPSRQIACQWELDDHDAHCDAGAVWRVVVHDCLGQRRCWTLCATHHDMLMNRWHRWLGKCPVVCSRCGERMARMQDAFPAVGRL
ncbi:MAG: hypothetical protein INR66_14925 [Gordonia polyisoprenivorans]|nr:hypothetical protein [Gordonia polyisoprenivorans]